MSPLEALTGLLLIAGYATAAWLYAHHWHPKGRW